MIKNMIYVLGMIRKKITLGMMISIIVTFALTVGLKFLFEFFFDIVPIKGGLNEIDISFYAIIVTIRLFVGILLENYMGDLYMTPVGTLIDNYITEKPNNNILKMDGGKNVSTGKEAAESSSNKGSSSENVSKMLSTDEMIDLQKEFSSNLTLQHEMIKKLKGLKDKHGLVYLLNERGALSISAPSSMPDNELVTVSKQVGIIDRIINTKIGDYDKLEFKDFVSNNSSIGKSFSGLKKNVKERYDELFEKE